MTIQTKKLRPNATLPTYGSEFAAGADLYACLDAPVIIEPRQTVMIPTGFAFAIPVGLAGFIYARSSLGSKRGLAPANKVGIIDSDYRGEVMVALHNHGTEAQTIAPNERIAQMVIAPYIAAQFEVSEELPDSERGMGGFGSTGK